MAICIQGLGGAVVRMASPAMVASEAESLKARSACVVLLLAAVLKEDCPEVQNGLCKRI